MGVRTTIAAALAATGMAVASAPAVAAHIPGFGFAAEEFTFDPSAYCDTCSEFTARFIDFSYRAEVDQQVLAFDETGVAFFSTFQYPDLGDPLSGNVTGLNTEYKMYATFSGAGTVAPNGAGGVDGTFSSFLVTIYIDPNMDSFQTNFTEGAGGGDETMGVTGGGEDVAILTGILDEGGFHLFPGLAAGDFDVLTTVTSFDATVWGGEAFAGPVVQADINGVNTLISGVGIPGTTFVDGRIQGSGNVSFQSIPEPGSLSLLGLGLLGFAGLLRRRRKAAA